MPAVHITGTSENEKLTVYFQCQIHASECIVCAYNTHTCLHNKFCVFLGEWISGAVCMFIANYLCENYEKDADVRKCWYTYISHRMSV